MIDPSADVEISVPSHKVWAVLTDFAAYPEWNPYVAVRGAASLGSKVQWAYSRQKVKRVWTSATITEFDPFNAIAWSFRIGWLFRLEEEFRIQPTRSGTRVTHSVRCQGIIAQLGKRSLKKTFVGVIAAANDGLRRQAESATRVSISSSGETSGRAKAKKSRVRQRSRRR